MFPGFNLNSIYPGGFTPHEGIRAQDAMVTESAGPIADRTREHLGSSDIAVVAMRRTLVEAATACAASGQIPKPVANPWLYNVRATQAVLPGHLEPDAADEIIQPARAQPAGASHPQESR